MFNAQTHDLRLAVTDNPVGGEPERMTCTQHTGDHQASLCVYPDHLHCYACGFHLTTIAALAFLLYGAWGRRDMGRARGVLDRYSARSLDAYRERVTQNSKTEPLPFGLAAAYHKMLTAYSPRHDRLEWLYARGLRVDYVSDFWLGHDGARFTIPVFDKDDKLLTIRYRRDDLYGLTTFDPRRGEEVAVPKYSGMRGRNGLFLFGANKLWAWGEGTGAPYTWVVVVEGELDAIRLWQEGIPAVSTTNGAGNVHRVPQMIRQQFPSITHLFFATDQDDPGRQAALEGRAAGLREGFQVTTLSWFPEWGKDVTELYLHGHTIEEATYDGDAHRLPAA